MTEIDRYTKISTSGQWKMTDNNVIVWEKVKEIRKYDAVLKDWFLTETTKEELSPEQSPFKLKKSMVIDVVLLREKQSEDEFNKTVLCYLRKYKLTVRPDNKNIWLTLGDDKRAYVKDILNQYTYRQQLASDPQVSVRKLSEHKITKEVAKKVETGYIFSKVEKIDDETELMGQFVAPKVR